MEKIISNIPKILILLSSIESTDGHHLLNHAFLFFALDWENYFSYLNPEHIHAKFLAKTLHVFFQFLWL